MAESNNLNLYEKFRSVPEEAKTEIKAGRTKGFTDINPMWRIKVLTQEFGPCGIGWYYKPVNKWIETVGNEIAAFVDIELYVKTEDGWSMPIFGTGGSRLATAESRGIYVSDECYKMATTDALSVACKQLGIGADVYFNKDITKYNNKAVEEKVNKDQLKQLRNEISRTGEKEIRILLTYSPQKLENMTVSQFQDAISKLEKKPDCKPMSQEEIQGLSEEAPFK